MNLVHPRPVKWNSMMAPSEMLSVALGLRCAVPLYLFLNGSRWWNNHQIPEVVKSKFDKIYPFFHDVATTEGGAVSFTTKTAESISGTMKTHDHLKQRMPNDGLHTGTQ